MRCGGKYFGIFFRMGIRRDWDSADASRPLLNKYRKWDGYYKYDEKDILGTFNGRRHRPWLVHGSGIEG